MKTYVVGTHKKHLNVPLFYSFFEGKKDTVS